MKKLLHAAVLSAAVGFTAPSLAQTCDAPQTDAEVAACLGAELRESDATINQSPSW